MRSDGEKYLLGSMNGWVGMTWENIEKVISLYRAGSTRSSLRDVHTASVWRLEKENFYSTDGQIKQSGSSSWQLAQNYSLVNLIDCF